MLIISNKEQDILLNMAEEYTIFKNDYYSIKGRLLYLINNPAGFYNDIADYWSINVLHNKPFEDMPLFIGDEVPIVRLCATFRLLIGR